MSEQTWTVRATYEELQAASWQLESENAALRAQLAEEKRINERTYCAYCGAEFPIDDPASPMAVSEHIRTCEKHPMRELERKLADMQSDYEVGRAIRERLGVGQCLVAGVLSYEVGELVLDEYSNKIVDYGYISKGATPLRALRAAGLLDKEAADERR